MRIRPFEALRPTAQTAAQIASKPYDIVNWQEARSIIEENPNSFMQVIRADACFGANEKVDKDSVYLRAKENFERLQKEKKLIREESPCFYLYQEKVGSHIQRGLVCTCHAEDYAQNYIKKHEFTQPAKVADRTQLNLTLKAHPGPVFATYPDNNFINDLLEKISHQEYLFRFNKDNIEHTLWKIEDTTPIQEAFEAVPVIYIADGHHRCESAANVAARMQSENPSHTADKPYNWFLTVLVPSSQLQILPYNRLIKDILDKNTDEFLRQLTTLGFLTSNIPPDPVEPSQINFYIDGTWYGLIPNIDAELPPVKQLSVNILHEQILEPFLGIEDPRNDPRLEFIGGYNSVEKIKEQVDAGYATIGCTLYPVSIEQVIDIANAGEVMPPKSTWLEPKLYSGLFVQTF